MFSGIRQAWYNHQDRKEAKKYEPKVKKEKTSSGISNKKPIILLAIVFSLVIFSIVGALIYTNSKKTKKSKDDTTITSELNSDLTTDIETTEETMSLPLYTEEPTKKHKKKKKKESENDYIYDESDIDVGGGGSNIVDSPNNDSGGGVISPKPYKKPKQKRKANNKVPTQYEKNSVLGGSKISLIKNSLRGSVNGVSNSNMRNLAIYMANNGTSNCTAALKSLCGYTTLKAGCKKVVVKIPSNSKDDVSNATVKICNKLAGSYGKYGFGVAARFSGNKYNITVVICYLK